MTSRDSITLTGLRVRANHGVYDVERENGQDFVVDVTVWLDLAPAASGDDVTATMHYGELAVEVTDAVKRDPVDLIETVAERVAAVVLAHERAEAVEVTLHKPDAPIEVPFEDVSVRILRERPAPGPEATALTASASGRAAAWDPINPTAGETR